MHRYAVPCHAPRSTAQSTIPGSGVILECYSAAPGSGLTDADASVIGPELTRLAEQGLANVAQIAAAAADPGSPLYGYVYGDSDADAARKYRVDLAGHLARSIRVTVVHEGVRREMRAFYPVAVEQHVGGPRQYVPVTVVAERIDLADQVRQDLWRQLVTWRSRAKDFEEFFDAIVAAIDAKRSEVEAA